MNRFIKILYDRREARDEGRFSSIVYRPSSFVGFRKSKISFILIALIFSIWGCASLSAEDQKKVCVREHCITAEVASKLEDWTKGLQHRTELAQEAGMLFIFEYKSPHRFWMKNTFIALDMIWIDEHYKIVDIAHNAAPCEVDPCETYTPKEAALYVLEVNAGYCQAKGIEIGDKVTF